MPRTRSSKKPGCFSQIKPTLVFTESPPERLPRRLLSPLAAADNPVTAKVLQAEDGLEATWVSPQFHGPMLEQDEAAKARRRGRKPRASCIPNGRSGMMSLQPSAGARRPVQRRSVAAASPALSERRLPKGFRPLQFVLDDQSRSGDSEAPELSCAEIVRDIDTRPHLATLDGGRSRRRKPGKKFGTESRDSLGDGLECNIPTRCHGSVTRSSPALEREFNVPADVHFRPKTNRGSSVGSCHGDGPHDHGDPAGQDPQQGFTNLKDRSLVSSRLELPSVGYSFSCVDSDSEAIKENVGAGNSLLWDDADGNAFEQSPKFVRDPRISVLDDGSRRPGRRHRTLSGMDVSRGNSPRNVPPLLSEVNAARCSELLVHSSKDHVLVTDTPEPEYGLRVTLRQRKALLSQKAMERLLLDS